MIGHKLGIGRFQIGAVLSQTSTVLARYLNEVTRFTDSNLLKNTIADENHMTPLKCTCIQSSESNRASITLPARILDGSSNQWGAEFTFRLTELYNRQFIAGDLSGGTFISLIEYAVNDNPFIAARYGIPFSFTNVATSDYLNTLTTWRFRSDGLGVYLLIDGVQKQYVTGSAKMYIDMLMASSTSDIYFFRGQYLEAKIWDFSAKAQGDITDALMDSETPDLWVVTEKYPKDAIPTTPTFTDKVKGTVCTIASSDALVFTEIDGYTSDSARNGFNVSTEDGIAIKIPADADGLGNDVEGNTLLHGAGSGLANKWKILNPTATLIAADVDNVLVDANGDSIELDLDNLPSGSYLANTKDSNGDESDFIVYTGSIPEPETNSLVSFTGVTITQTGDIANDTVQYQTAAVVIAALPISITVTLEDATTESIPITWADTDTYDPTTAGDYTFTATWGTLPTGVDNDDSLTAPTVELTVVQGSIGVTDSENVVITGLLTSTDVDNWLVEAIGLYTNCNINLTSNPAPTATGLAARDTLENATYNNFVAVTE
jgi:hypothetical protein